jgi:hypothetical protein
VDGLPRQRPVQGVTGCAGRAGINDRTFSGVFHGITFLAGSHFIEFEGSRQDGNVDPCKKYILPLLPARKRWSKSGNQEKEK